MFYILEYYGTFQVIRPVLVRLYAMHTLFMEIFKLPITFFPPTFKTGRNTVQYSGKEIASRDQNPALEMVGERGAWAGISALRQPNLRVVLLLGSKEEEEETPKELLPLPSSQLFPPSRFSKKEEEKKKLCFFILFLDVSCGWLGGGWILEEEVTVRKKAFKNSRILPCHSDFFPTTYYGFV